MQTCLECGSELYPSDNFCSKCGEDRGVYTPRKTPLCRKVIVSLVRENKGYSLVADIERYTFDTEAQARAFAKDLSLVILA